MIDTQHDTLLLIHYDFYVYIKKKLKRRIMKFFFALIFFCMFYYTISDCMTQKEEQLFDAIENNKSYIVQQLINEKVNVNVKNNVGETPLMLASYRGYRDIVNMLLKVDVIKIDEPDNIGWTAVMYAVDGGKLSIVKKLIEKGADVNTQDDLIGITPLEYASNSGYEYIVDSLLNANAKINKQNNLGWTALMRAGELSIVKKLIERGARVDLKDNDGKTALYHAKLGGKKNIIDFLEKKLADTDTKNLMINLQKLQHSLTTVSKLLK